MCETRVSSLIKGSVLRNYEDMVAVHSVLSSKLSINSGLKQSVMS